MAKQASETRQHVPDLLVWFAGEKLFVHPESAMGLGLLCKVPAGPRRLASSTILFNYAATDQSAYWAAWRACGGVEQGLVFASGDPVELSCSVPVPTKTESVVKYPSRWQRVWLAILALGRALRDAIFPPVSKDHT
jgi:hypothetical protein